MKGDEPGWVPESILGERKGAFLVKWVGCETPEWCNKRALSAPQFAALREDWKARASQPQQSSSSSLHAANDVAPRPMDVDSPADYITHCTETNGAVSSAASATQLSSSSELSTGHGPTTRLQRKRALSTEPANSLDWATKRSRSQILPFLKNSSMTCWISAPFFLLYQHRNAIASWLKNTTSLPSNIRTLIAAFNLCNRQKYDEARDELSTMCWDNPNLMVKPSQPSFPLNFVFALMNPTTSTRISCEGMRFHF